MRISDWSSDVCSSDLSKTRKSCAAAVTHCAVTKWTLASPLKTRRSRECAFVVGHVRYASLRLQRSEEHTSELQSLMRISYAVFCLKKKKKHNNGQDTTTVHRKSPK